MLEVISGMYMGAQTDLTVQKKGKKLLKGGEPVKLSSRGVCDLLSLFLDNR